MFRTSFVAAMLSVGCLFTELIHADTIYVAFGDSITAGAWASTALPDSPLPPPFDQIGRDQRTFLFFERKSTLSWATGLMIPSFATRLRNSGFVRSDGGDLQVINVARSGVPSEDLQRQFELFKKEARGLEKKGLLKNKQRLNLVVTLLIGANDICDRKLVWGSVERTKFKTHVENLIAQLDALPGFHSKKLIVSSIPRTTLLGDPAISKARMYQGWTCEQVRDNILHICPSLVTWRDDAGRAEVDRVWDDLNQILASATEKKRAQLETVFSWALGRQKPKPELLAHDCFHPNSRGQALIAEDIWAVQPWF